MLNSGGDISVHSIIVSIINGAAVGIGINASMVVFFGGLRAVVKKYHELKDEWLGKRNAVAKVGRDDRK